MLKIAQRSMTLQDFLKLKKTDPYGELRQTSKTLNFSLIFNCTPASLARTLIKNGYTLKQANSYLATVGRKAQKLKHDLMYPEYGNGLSDDAATFQTAATFLREAYFELYKGLETRLARELEAGKKYGFIMGWHGTTRWVYPLKFMRFDKDGKLTGGDRSFYSKKFSELQNICGNTNAQTVEVRIVAACMVEVCFWLDTWGLKTRLFNMVHDSMDYYTGETVCPDGSIEDEDELVTALVSHVASKVREPYHGIPMCIDAEIAIPWKKDKKGHWQTYKHGEGMDPIDLDVAIKNYNEKTGKNISYNPENFKDI